MSTYSLYDTTTGLFTGVQLYTQDPDTLLANVPNGQSALQGAYDHLTQKFDLTSQQVVAYTPPPAPLADRQAQVWEAIKTRRDQRKAGGVQVGTDWFHSDDASRIQQIGLVMMGQSMPANLQWKTMTGAFVTMTPALAQQVFNAVASFDQATFAAAETHRQNMLAAADPLAYDYSGGWPPIYGEGA